MKRLMIPVNARPPQIPRKVGGKKKYSFVPTLSWGHSRVPSSKTFEQFRHVLSPYPSMILLGQ
jgi:hypothetical protein